MSCSPSGRQQLIQHSSLNARVLTDLGTEHLRVLVVGTHSSIADDRSLSSLQFEHVAAVRSVGEQEVRFQAFVRFLEQGHIHPLKERRRCGRQVINRGRWRF